jgi:single-strand DNA-binding protein
MSTTITFAGNLAEDSELLYTRDGKELLYTRDGKPFVSCQALVNRRVLNDEGDWVKTSPRRTLSRSTDPRLSTSTTAAGPGTRSSCTASSARACRTKGPSRSAPRTSSRSTTASARSGVWLKYFPVRLERASRVATQAG